MKKVLFAVISFAIAALFAAFGTYSAFADFSNDTWCRIANCGYSLQGILCLRGIVGTSYQNRDEEAFLRTAPQRCQAGQQTQQTDPCQEMVDTARRNNTLLRASAYQDCVRQQQQQTQPDVTDYSDIQPMDETVTPPDDTAGVQPALIKPTEVTSTKTTPSDASKMQDSFKTIKDRCKAAGVPVESCCQPPDYWLNSSCPYQMKGQDLEWKPQSAPISADQAENNKALFSSGVAPQEKTPLADRAKEISDTATKLTAGTLLDASGKKVDEARIIAGAGLSEDVPAATVQFPLKDIKSGQPIEAIVSGKVSGYLPLDKVVAIPDESIQDSTMVVSVGLGSKPELLGGGAMGAPDFPIPDPQQYQTLNYFKVDVFHGKVPAGGITAETREVSYKEVLLSMVVAAKDLADPRTNFLFNDPSDAAVTFLHWNKKSQKYEELPAERGLCEQNYHWCRYTAKTSGLSPFAIVLKKPRTSVGVWVVLILWFALLVAAHIKWWRPVSREFKNAKSKAESLQILKKVGFLTYVFFAGVFLIGGYIGSILSLLIAWYYLSWTLLLPLLIGGLVWGFVIGLISWLLLRWRYRARKP